MNHICLLMWAALALGPSIDPIEGATVGRQEKSALPSGRHVGSVADLWFVELTSLQNGGSGIARFDPLQLSSHGYSWTQLQHRLDGLDYTDPAHPGSPLIELPYDAWQTITYGAMWDAMPSFNWQLPQKTHKRAQLNIGGGLPIGGNTWVPQGFMDREPATDFGATDKRRSLQRAWEIDASAHGTLLSTSSSAYVERLSHTHVYPTLVEPDSTTLQEDRAERLTAIVYSDFTLWKRPTRILMAGMEGTRSHEGAQFRFPLALTHSARDTALMTHLHHTLANNRAIEASVKFGAAFRRGLLTARNEEAIAVDMEREWMLLARPLDDDDVSRLRLDGLMTWKLKAGSLLSQHPLHLEMTASHATIETVIDDRALLAGIVYQDDNDPAEPMRDGYLRIWDQVGTYYETIQTLRLNADWAWRNQRWTIKSSATIDWAGLGNEDKRLMGSLSFGYGIAARIKLDGYELMTLARSQPQAISVQAASFVNYLRPSGGVYQWLDDGDAIPEANEQGAMVRSTGGSFHSLDPSLTRPTHRVFVVGAKIHQLGPFSFTITGNINWLRHRYTVRYDPSTAPNYESKTIEDPGGAKNRATQGEKDPEHLEVWARQPGGEGDERYWLTNAEDDDLFVGTTFQFTTQDNNWWFMNLAATGYMAMGASPFGAFPDRNDPGIINEVTADPNTRVNDYGRYDSCRAFGINLLTGAHWSDALTTALVIRYRDGQPFTRILVTPLPQGPTPIMTVRRGEPVPRHTFQLTLDARLRYKWQWSPLQVSINLDFMNILGSGTELVEDPRAAGDYRRSIEMIPGRSVFVKIGIDWLS